MIAPLPLAYPTVVSHLAVMVGLCTDDPKDLKNLEVRSQLRADQTRVGRLLHVTSALLLVSASQPTTAL